MFTGNHLVTPFKEALLKGVHDFDSHSFKIALYTNEADLNASTAAYTTSGEVSGTGYTAGGETLTGAAVTSSGTTALVTFEDVTWADSTLTARGALIYNSTAAGSPAVAVLDFGSDKVSNGTPFVITFPPATEDLAVVRIA